MCQRPFNSSIICYPGAPTSAFSFKELPVRSIYLRKQTAQINRGNFGRSTVLCAFAPSHTSVISKGFEGEQPRRALAKARTASPQVSTSMASSTPRDSLCGWPKASMRTAVHVRLPLHRLRPPAVDDFRRRGEGEKEWSRRISKSSITRASSSGKRGSTRFAVASSGPLPDATIAAASCTT